jgi:hypothetical protein
VDEAPRWRVSRCVVRYSEVRLDAEVEHLLREIAQAVALVAAERLRLVAATAESAQHLQRLISFGVARRWSDAQIDAQAVAVLHQHVPRVAQLRLLAVALPREPRLGIRRRFRPILLA